MILVVMGVTGSGKTTVGKLLANRLSIPFLDADDFHSKENVKKMSDGVPLTDEDRHPWLSSISEALEEKEKAGGAVLACSALKVAYRALLQQSVSSKIIWVHLEGKEELILERLKKRTQHFMPASLLSSQFATLESPIDAHSCSIENSPEDIVEEILKKLK